MTGTSGASDAQVSEVRDPDRSDSQADSAGSIPVTRSNVKPQVKQPNQGCQPCPARRLTVGRVPDWRAVRSVPGAFSAAGHPVDRRGELPFAFLTGMKVDPRGVSQCGALRAPRADARTGPCLTRGRW